MAYGVKPPPLGDLAFNLAETVLRFVKSIGAWPGRVVVIACEPAEVQDVGWGLSDEVQDAVGRAVELVVETVAELRSGAVVHQGE